MLGRDLRSRSTRRICAGVVIGVVAGVLAGCAPPDTAPTTTVSGSVFTDDFADGSQDPGDSGLSGWTVAVYPAVGGEASGETPVASATTGATGTYSLVLGPGEYVICETLPSFVNPLDEWHQSGLDNSVCAPVDGVAPHGHAVTIAASSITVDFANYQNYAVGYWFGRDADGDGIHDGVAPAPSGQTVDLYEDLDVDGVVDAGEPLAYTKDANGSSGAYYAYASLQQFGIRPGRYVACQRLVAGQTQIAPVNAACSEVSAATGGFPLIAASGGGSNDDFFLIGPGIQTITGTVRVDTFAVRVRDQGAPVPMYGAGAGVTVEAWADVDGDGVVGGSDTLTQSTVTDSGGAFSFALPGADYVICEVLPAGAGLYAWHQSYPLDSRCAGAAGTAAGGHAVPAGSSGTIGFFNYRNYAVAYSVGGDVDLDGVNDGVAYPIGWSVDLYDDPDQDGIVATGSVPVYTDAANGFSAQFRSVASFQNPGITPGFYVACLTGRTGFSQTAPANIQCANVSSQAGGFSLQASSGGASNNKLFLVSPVP